MLSFYNQLTGKKERFESLVPKIVKMYVCGVTVYDYCHIGHARSALVFDVIRRYLEFSGYQVEFVKNFTDVDDKIIKRANEQGVSCETITAKFIDAYDTDMGRLGIKRATKEPKAQAAPEILTWWQEIMQIPCVAIGGISVTNGGLLVEAGADFLAVSSGVWDHPEGPKAAVAAFSMLFDSLAK